METKPGQVWISCSPLQTEDRFGGPLKLREGVDHFSQVRKVLEQKTMGKAMKNRHSRKASFMYLVLSRFCSVFQHMSLKTEKTLTVAKEKLG